MYKILSVREPKDLNCPWSTYILTVQYDNGEKGEVHVCKTDYKVIKLKITLIGYGAPEDWVNEFEDAVREAKENDDNVD